MLTLIITCMHSPYDLAFQNDSLSNKIFSNIIDSLFLIDIFVIFNTAFFTEYMVIVDDRRLIAKKYLTGWFIVDLISIVPFEYIMESFNNNYNNILKLARMGKLYRLLKLTKLVRIFKLVKDTSKFLKYFQEILSVTFGLQRFIFFCIILIMLCHIGACLWILFP